MAECWAWDGYVGGAVVQGASAIAAIEYLYIQISLILFIVLFGLYWVYKLDKLYPQILAELSQRNA